MEIPGTFNHIFWACPTIQTLWQNIFRDLNSIRTKNGLPISEMLELDKDKVMLGLYPNSWKCLLYVVPG